MALELFQPYHGRIFINKTDAIKLGRSGELSIHNEILELAEITKPERYTVYVDYKSLEVGVQIGPMGSLKAQKASHGVYINIKTLIKRLGLVPDRITLKYEYKNGMIVVNLKDLPSKDSDAGRKLTATNLR